MEVLGLSFEKLIGSEIAISKEELLKKDFDLLTNLERQYISIIDSMNFYENSVYHIFKGRYGKVKYLTYQVLEKGGQRKYYLEYYFNDSSKQNYHSSLKKEEIEVYRNSIRQHVNEPMAMSEGLRNNLLSMIKNR